ncbi:outer membrane protein [Bradyrhizobium sp. CCGUVB23]|uniref:outer membrane protein n=1 Tax=Bradyrhizobium sp. CCGUVB23 TaxID=2949630 RepID=UPI0020B24B3C|nr:outer membrane beta-barrel protein [Bradyrhizobium sp. CCGUVB23]MCP3462821.1 outer membrane beta-barrel protein [Bradyrhizobium sp. CCGUVB23]
MHRLSLLVATSLAAVPASAADLIARKAPLQETQVFSWTGFYAGAHLGGGSVYETQTFLGTTGFAIDPVGTSYTTNRSSVLGGINAGYNYQVGHVVLGVAGDVSGTRANGSSVTPAINVPGFVLTSNGRTDWYATLTGRLGVTFDQVLLYGKGGVAWSRQVYDGRADGFASVIYSPFSDIRTGYVVGAGAEWAATRNISMFAEYNYLNFSTKTYNVTDTTGAVTTTYSAKTSANLAKLGVNYHF